MAHPSPYPYLTNRERQLIALPSGPIELPKETAYTLIGVYPATSNEVNHLRVASGVVNNNDTVTKTALRTTFNCKEPNCTYRMMSLRNADEVAMFEKGEHNHVVKPTAWKPKPINDPATIDATIDEVIERMRFDGDSDADGPDISKGSVGASSNVENAADPVAIEATIDTVIERMRNAGKNNGNTVEDNRSNVEKAAAVPAPSKAPQQPTARGMGKRHWKQNCRTPWKFRTPFGNFADLVDCLMAQGATPYRSPYMQNGKVKRLYRCGKCNYFGLSLRDPSASKPCMLYETRIHCHDVVEVDPKHRHLYFEVPDELNSDDKATDHDETVDAMEVDAPLRGKKPLVDYPDSDDAMDVDASSNDAPKAADSTDSHLADKTAAANAPNGGTEATVAVPDGPVIEVEYHPPHGALSVWMDRLRRLQDAVDEFVDETRTVRRERKAGSSTDL
uniref:FLYWCH-type domain-containing protein n=1 Tax=Panagrellus redivivus TaxID=6233 RepID=A0A7E4VNY7_PANRE